MYPSSFLPRKFLEISYFKFLICSFQAPIDIQDFNPDSFKPTVDASLFELPSYCQRKSCSFLSSCHLVNLGRWLTLFMNKKIEGWITWKNRVHFLKYSKKSQKIPKNPQKSQNFRKRKIPKIFRFRTLFLKWFTTRIYFPAC